MQCWIETAANILTQCHDLHT